MSRVQVPFPARRARPGDLELYPDRLLFEVMHVIKNKNSELLENSGVRLTITVEKDFIRKQYDELVAEHGRTVRLDGFRKGKVPAGILIRKFGDVLVGETAERVI